MMLGSFSLTELVSAFHGLFVKTKLLTVPLGFPCTYFHVVCPPIRGSTVTKICSALISRLLSCEKRTLYKGLELCTQMQTVDTYL